MKKVLLVVIDALASEVVQDAFRDKRLPVLSRLAELGSVDWQCLSVFPSITPAATASIVTGEYPVRHGIAGSFWYERSADRVAFYGDDIWVILQEGVDKFFNDYLVRLNFERLQSEQLYERVEREGLTACALNYMWFGGRTQHTVQSPWLVSWLPWVKLASRVRGPQSLALGDFVHSRRPGSQEAFSSNSGVLRRYGFDDETTGAFLRQLCDDGSFPDFTLAYFPNNDFDSHRVGPVKALATLERVDEILGDAFQRAGGMESFLEEVAVVVLGDHSQSAMQADASERAIDLDSLTEEFSRVPAGAGWKKEEQLMVCPNLRAAQFYLRDPGDSTLRDRLARRLLSDSRVDQVIWQEGSAESAQDAAVNAFVISTADRGTLKFWPTENQMAAGASDDHGNRWAWEGGLEAIDARVTAQGSLQYGDYPNALERIAGGFCSEGGEVWATARLGCDFRIQETKSQAGGSHGTLHRLDSTTVLITAGLPAGVSPPRHPRLVDVAPLCLRILGVEAGEEHSRAALSR